MSRKAGQSKIKSQADLVTCEDLIWFINVDFGVCTHVRMDKEFLSCIFHKVTGSVHEVLALMI